MVFLCELGSASQFMIASMAATTNQTKVVWIAGCLALLTTSFFAAQFGYILNKLPISPALISGIIMISVGLTLIAKG